MANKFYSQKPNVGYGNIFTTKQDITNYFKINSDNYYADLYSKYKLQLEPKNSNLSVANVDLGYKIGGVDIKNYITANYVDYLTTTTFTVDSKYKKMSIILVGGGGSGGSGANVADGAATWSEYGAIGGSGAVYISDYIISSSSDSYTVTIGQGGSSVKQSSYNPSDGVNGNPGGNTTFTNTTKNWYITAGGGGGGGMAIFRFSSSGNTSTTPGSGGTNWDSGTTTNFTNNYKYTGLGDGTTNVGGYWRCSQLTQDNINNYPTLYKINGSSAEYGNAGNGGRTQWKNGGGENTRSSPGQPGFCRIYFK